MTLTLLCEFILLYVMYILVLPFVWFGPASTRRLGLRAYRVVIRGMSAKLKAAFLSLPSTLLIIAALWAVLGQPPRQLGWKVIHMFAFPGVPDVPSPDQRKIAFDKLQEVPTTHNNVKEAVPAAAALPPAPPQHTTIPLAGSDGLPNVFPRNLPRDEEPIRAGSARKLGG